MQAMLLEQAKPVEEDPLRLVDLDVPPPGPGEFRLRLQVCGVCRTDSHTVQIT